MMHCGSCQEKRKSVHLITKSSKNSKYLILDISCSVDAYTNMTDIRKKADPKVVYQKIEKCGGMQNDTNHAIGTRVMFWRDTNVAKGLVSGYMGTVEGFIWPALGRKQRNLGQMPEAVLVRFENSDTAPNMPELATADSCIKIEPCSVVFQAKKGKTISRYMLPLIHCWAVTIHKMQRASLTKAVVDLDCFGNALDRI